jgi:hypothetical protein
MIKLRKCKLKNCLLNEKEDNSFYCSEFIPNIVNETKPDDITCEFYSTSLKDDLEWLKKKGGMLGLILSQSNKKTEKDLKEELKEKKARTRKKKKNV